MKKQIEYLTINTDVIWVILKGVRHRAHGTRQIGKGIGHSVEGEGRKAQDIMREGEGNGSGLCYATWNVFPTSSNSFTSS